MDQNQPNPQTNAILNEIIALLQRIVYLQKEMMEEVRRRKIERS